MFKVLRNGLLRYMLDTCPKPNVTRVQSATQWTASVHTLHMSKPKRPRRKGPLPSQSLNPRKKLWVWKARLRCWKRMAIKAWPKGDRKALCHRFSNAQSGFKELEAERHWGEVAQGYPKYRFWGLFCQKNNQHWSIPDCQVRDTRWQRMGALKMFKLFGSAESTSKATPSKASLKSRWMMQRWKGEACWKRMGPPKHWLMLHLPQVKMMLSLAMKRPSPKRTRKKTSRAARRGKHQGRHQEGAPSQRPLECLVLSLAMRRPSPKKSRKRTSRGSRLRKHQGRHQEGAL